LTFPLWTAFLPAALAWTAAGFRGMSPERLISTNILSLVLGPLIGAYIVSSPIAVNEATAVAFTSLRHSIAITIAIMLPLCIVCSLAGLAARGALAKRIHPSAK
ncbi:MAG: hypothetical protein GX316_00180, partial [Firmicutes bacterium]|nr:hypothetical protein [Bacillota bacterium]